MPPPKQFFNQSELDALSKRIERLGSKLSADDCTEFRSILFDMNCLYYGIAEVYKTAEINLIPGKVQTPIDHSKESFTSVTFKPTTKQDKGNPLSELLHNLSQEDRAKIAGAIEQNLKKE